MLMKLCYSIKDTGGKKEEVNEKRNEEGGRLKKPIVGYHGNPVQRHPITNFDSAYSKASRSTLPILQVYVDSSLTSLQRNLVKHVVFLSISLLSER